MGEFLRKVFIQISEFLKKIPPGQKIGMGVIGSGIIIGMSYLIMWAGDTTFAPLMTNLNPEDSSNIIRVLREKHIPFKVDPSGKNVTVPPENLYELRLELATMGLPQSSVVGYEVFDKQSLGTTSFVQKINQKRAQEGELMRTINNLKGVKRSRVHLAIPQKSTFIEDQRKPTASVVIDLDAGTVLSDKQVYGIGNLVARAVEGMEVTDVVVMDSNGKVLSKNPSDPLAAATATQLDYIKKVEEDYEKRIEAILSRIVGDGHVVAKVSADLDFSQVYETQTVVDGDSAAVRSMEKRNDTMSGSRPGPYGAMGAVSNTPGQAAPTGNEIKNDTTKTNERVNYEIPQTHRRITRPTGQVKKLSVAVVVDGKQVKTDGKGGAVEIKSQAWPQERLKEFEDIVASTVGIDKKRGDILEIRNMDFTREDFKEAEDLLAKRERDAYIQNAVIYGVIGLTVIMFFFFVVRPFIKWFTENTVDSVDTFLPQTIEELERIQKNTNLPSLEEAVPVMPEKVDPEKVEGEMIKEKITTLVDANPHKAALILKDWLHLDGKGKAKGKGDEPEGPGGKTKTA